MKIVLRFVILILELVIIDFLSFFISSSEIITGFKLNF